MMITEAGGGNLISIGFLIVIIKCVFTLMELG